ncbi:multidrug effflux MFS transporter [Arhodomonas aquaeolei]|uniref:multidrug effflux MFS transporter n=1 Tax=Arhodomonas aquaeolei TaxID=2369 RepID=UPI0021698295|nr:multidrug effflux MFS transporter [Arhodomonas aquaeolei]MCS4502707.1 multidrug effflux MFS transporter [Arhodomonas aquaeolei]
MLEPKSRTTTLLLAALVAIGPLATDLYLPALPAISRALEASSDEVQLTLSVYMLGFALSQLIYGPLADRFGRKPVIVGGLALFVLATIGCALAPTIETMIALRFLQALGGCVGPVLGRAAVRDIHGHREAARVLSHLATAMALAPAAAPVLGGYLLVAAGWPSLFVVLAVYAAVVTATVALALPEPLPATYRQPIRPGVIAANYRTLVRSRVFVGYSLAVGFVFGGLFAFLSGSSFVLIEFLGVAEEHYGLYFTLVVLGYMGGSIIGGRLSRRWGIERLMLAGSLLSAAAGSAMAGLSAASVYTVAAVIVPHMLFMTGVGIVMPQAMAGAIGPFPQMAGSASALLGFIQMAIAAGAGALVGQFHDGTSHSMAFIIAAMGLATLASFLLIARPAERAPARETATPS